MQEKLEKLITKAEEAYLDAQNNRAKIASDWRVMDQYSLSSKKFKILLNNLCTLENSAFLEVGSFRGATICAAAYGNKLLAAYAVDNFSYDPLSLYTDEQGQISNTNPQGWPNIKIGFADIVNKLDLNKTVKLHAGDWNKTPDGWIKHKISIFHIDIRDDVGEILKFYDKYLDDSFILVVANYNETDIIEQIGQWVENSKYLVAKKITKFSSSNADSDGWWNGLGIYVINKQVTK